MNDYENLKTKAKSWLDNPFPGGGRDASELAQARSQQGIGYAILALAEALRPEPLRVDLAINTDEVKAAIREAVE